MVLPFEFCFRLHCFGLYKLQIAELQQSYRLYCFGRLTKTSQNALQKSTAYKWEALFAPFYSENQLVLCLNIISHFSTGDLLVLKSGNRTKGWPSFL